MQTQASQTPNSNTANKPEFELQQRIKSMEKELLETEKVLAQETLEHARTKETLAYTRGLLDRADKSEVAIHKFLDKQEERHQHVVGKLEEKVIDANRKIATIARELGAKEERIALISGAPQLPGNAPAPTAEETPPKALPELPLDVPFVWSVLGGTLTVGIWMAPKWEFFTRATATAAVWFALAWLVQHFWLSVAKVHGLESSPRAKKLKTICRLVGGLGVVTAVMFLSIAFFTQG